MAINQINPKTIDTKPMCLIFGFKILKPANKRIMNGRQHIKNKLRFSAQNGMPICASSYVIMLLKTNFFCALKAISEKKLPSIEIDEKAIKV